MTHRLHETRSLTMHRMVAEHFRQNPGFVIRFALENLERWHQRGVECDDHAIWKDLLLEDPDKLAAILTGITEEATRLRQSSPFAGLIPEAERRRILVTPE